MSSRVRMSRTLFILSILAFWTSTCDLLGQRIFSSDGGQPAAAKRADVRNNGEVILRLSAREKLSRAAARHPAALAFQLREDVEESRVPFAKPGDAN